MIFFIPLLLFYLSITSFAATEIQQAELLMIDSAFINADYERVELLSLRLLQNEQSLTPQEAARVHVTTGYALIMLNRDDEARDHFRRALDAEPELTLDPVQVSPKFRVVFDDVKSEYQKKKTAPMTETRIEQRGVSNAALISNLFIPGSGQWREGKKVRGAIIFTLQAATVGVLIWRISETRQSREDYLAETDAARISDAYDEYNTNYLLAWGAGTAVAAVYLGAQIDLISMQKKRTLAIYPRIGNIQGITASLHF
jgi:hypothetical protein